MAWLGALRSWSVRVARDGGVASVCVLDGSDRDEVIGPRSPIRGGAGVGGDRGAATIYAATVGLIIVLLGLAIAVRASSLVAAAQAGTAADLAALAGAMHATAGQEVACARAAQFAHCNGATVLSCYLDGLDLTVTVRLRDAQATARAGPIRSDVNGDGHQ